MSAINGQAPELTSVSSSGCCGDSCACWKMHGYRLPAARDFCCIHGLLFQFAAPHYAAWIPLLSIIAIQIASKPKQVYGESFLKWAYGNQLGRIALHSFVKRPFFSAWYGRRMDHPQTADKVVSIHPAI
ncbi:hypothetical protein [Rubritalea tangerina]|uniref:hypothetical protein n=1 Tax=Rubritalea tangerina TaxID=430798 RepID=UPI0036230931